MPRVTVPSRHLSALQSALPWYARQLRGTQRHRDPVRMANSQEAAKLAMRVWYDQAAERTIFPKENCHG
jgi:hypothetical protein